jgi:hypothetical protein
MRRFVEGVDRGQGALFPECLEDWICEDNPVRAIDVFAVTSIGFSRAGGLSARPGATLRRCGSRVGWFPITRRLLISAQG